MNISDTLGISEYVKLEIISYMEFYIVIHLIK